MQPHEKHVTQDTLYYIDNGNGSTVILLFPFFFFLLFNAHNKWRTIYGQGPPRN